MEAKPTLALILSTITLVGALFTLDARYVHAEENKKEVITTQQKIEQTQKLITQATNNLRKASLEDKVFEIDVKIAQKKASPIDTALKERFLRQLEEIK
jgi:hypothetical protein